MENDKKTYNFFAQYIIIFGETCLIRFSKKSVVLYAYASASAPSLRSPIAVCLRERGMNLECRSGNRAIISAFLVFFARPLNFLCHHGGYVCGCTRANGKYSICLNLQSCFHEKMNHSFVFI
jgi:hypothetical protein